MLYFSTEQKTGYMGGGKWGSCQRHRLGLEKVTQRPDHIFTLNAIVEKKKSLSKRGGKLYTCFVDLKKAFDSVQRGPLFHILCQNGLSGKFLNALGAIYKSVVSCVRIGDRLTEFFDCPAGLRQGCILSPMLFSLFINEIASIRWTTGYAWYSANWPGVSGNISSAFLLMILFSYLIHQGVSKTSSMCSVQLAKIFFST